MLRALASPTAGPIQSLNGALVIPCTNALVVLAAATGSSYWSTSIAPSNQIGGVAIVSGHLGEMRVVMTTFDGSLIVFKSIRDVIEQSQSQFLPPTTSVILQQPLHSSVPLTSAVQTNQSFYVEPPISSVSAPLLFSPPPRSEELDSVPFSGTIT
jgi:hypothetical protein